MRSISVFLAGLILAQAAFAQIASTPGANSLSDLRFSGAGTNDTTVFGIGNRWQVSWTGPPINVTVESPDGTIIAGSGGGMGSLFIASGGSYKLHVSPDISGSFQWTLTVHAVGPAGGMVAFSPTNRYVPPDMTTGSPFGTPTMTARSPVTPGVGLPPSLTLVPNGPVAYGPGGSPVTPTPTPTPAAASASPAPPSAAAPASKLTEAQAAAVVLIRGDNAEGTGFLVKTAAGPFVITNQHVIAANPHVQITTSSGQPVTYTGLQGANDRDLAMIPIQDNHFSYLALASDLGATVQVGDAVITPGNSEGGGVMLDTNGTVLALGPQKIEISNPVYHGNSGGPIFHVKSGTVIGVVTEGQKVDTADALDQASHQNPNSAISGQMRYFGLRLDNVSTWEPYTWPRFENETEFLEEFHERNKCLDSYLNTASNDNSDWGLYYLRDSEIKTANETARNNALGSDTAQQLDGERTLAMTLDGVADSRMDQIQQPGNFYLYDRIRAHDETDYRTALKKEIADMSLNVERIGHLARTNSSQ